LGPAYPRFKISAAARADHAGSQAELEIALKGNPESRHIFCHETSRNATPIEAAVLPVFASAKKRTTPAAISQIAF
jgi:hypothetical protein